MTTYTTEYINEHSKDFLAFRDAFRKVWHSHYSEDNEILFYIAFRMNELLKHD